MRQNIAEKLYFRIMRVIRSIIIISLVLSAACQSANDKIKKTDIISIDKLVPIIVEMHLADGLMQTANIRLKYPGRDSISNYRDVLVKHGYSKETFDRTIEFYENDPDMLNDLYDEVISELTKFQSEIEQVGRQRLPDDKMPDLWNQKVIWHLPDDGTTNSIEFNIPISEPGKYILTATIRMHLDDGSKEPRVTAYFWYDDGTESGFKIPFTPSPIEKNGRIRVHSLTLNLEDSRATHLRGFLLDHDPQPGHWEKHADVMNVKLQCIRPKSKSVGRE